MEEDWEARWAPYDEATYNFVLERLRPDDVVLDIGAGDLRLAMRMAPLARRVYAIERRRDLLELALARLRETRPANLIPIWADAVHWPFPPGVTVGVLLMRHCRHFALYFNKLRTVGCRRLLTNARWRMGVEEIDLRGDRLPFAAVEIGWYACQCGHVGFVPGPPERLTPELEASVYEVRDCPACDIHLRRP